MHARLHKASSKFKFRGVAKCAWHIHNNESSQCMKLASFASYCVYMMYVDCCLLNG